MRLRAQSAQALRAVDRLWFQVPLRHHVPRWLKLQTAQQHALVHS
jgi:hypothetical protein